MKDIEKELTELLNCACAENESDTPDFILAAFMLNCLTAFNHATKDRSEWYGNPPDRMSVGCAGQKFGVV